LVKFGGITMEKSNKGHKRTLSGTVVSTKSSKTIVVKVERRFKHPVYSKFVTKSKKYHAHDENESKQVGDKVNIVESKAYSKLKRWSVA